MTKAFITFLPGEKKVEIGTAQTVLEVALTHKIPLSHSCGGMGSCTTCRVFIVSSPTPLAEREDLEREIAESRNFADDERLACQISPVPNLIVRLP